MGIAPDPAARPKPDAGDSYEVRQLKQRAVVALAVPGAVEQIAAKNGYDPAKYRAALQRITNAPTLTREQAEAFISDAHPETARIAAEQAAAQAAQSASTEDQAKAERLAAEQAARTKEKIALDRERLQLEKDRILLEAAIRAGARSAE